MLQKLSPELQEQISTWKGDLQQLYERRRKLSSKDEEELSSKDEEELHSVLEYWVRGEEIPDSILLSLSDEALFVFGITIVMHMKQCIDHDNRWKEEVKLMDEIKESIRELEV